MSPRSPLFKSILWRAFRAGGLVGVSVHAPARPRSSAVVRLHFRSEYNQLKFAAGLEEAHPVFEHDMQLGTNIGAKSGLLFYAELPLSSIRTIRHREPLTLPLVGGLQGLKPIHSQLARL